MQLSFIYV